MSRTNSSLSHRNVPSLEDIIRHQWREVIEKSQPNSISANVLTFPDFLESTSIWNQRHIISFQMLDFNDIPIINMYPALFHPSDIDLVIKNVTKLFVFLLLNSRLLSLLAIQLRRHYGYY
jgi:hypothetical protein